MKNRLLALISCSLAALACTAHAHDHARDAGLHRDMPDRYGYVGGHLSQYWFDTDKISFREVTLPGLQAGLRFHENWSAQLWWERNNVVRDTPGPRTYATVTLLSLRHHFHDTSLLGFEPYAGITGGQIRFDRSGSNQRHEQELIGIEAGVQRRLTDHWVLDLGARPMRAASRDNAIEGEIYAALNFVIGERRRPAPPVTADTAPATPHSACPDTPADVPVDSRGCPLDSDGDGVPDYLDRCPDTPTGAQVDEHGCPVSLEQSLRETLYVEFELNQAVLRQQDIPRLAVVAHMMQQYPEGRLRLEGHTDNSGSAERNTRLSAQRAEAVRDALVLHYDVDPARIDAVGVGPAQPIADNHSAEGRARNRRVEAILQ
ncbi:OmpA family protein [Isoalcanivorax indicus]|uniref:OmpA family protein n=1 Tax=Isoalcanivorax indicus TaxID=2202653 RepID=UPI000DBA7B78|nr:OmpA family protein [Isoalcanivorax indicus]